MDILERLVTLGTQDTQRRQTNEKKNTTPKTKMVNNTDLTKTKLGVNPGAH
jgi:hypothetical protein